MTEVNVHKVRLVKYNNALDQISQISKVLGTTYEGELDTPQYVYDALHTLRAMLYYEMSRVRYQIGEGDGDGR